VTDLTFRALRDANAGRAPHIAPINSWQVHQWLLKLGEAIRAYNKGTEPNLIEEIADVVIVADLLAQRMGFGLGEAVRSKFNERSKKVGYPKEL
jgi:hypothetical protein